MSIVSARLAGATFALSVVAMLPAAAQIRTEPSAASLVNPATSADARTLFERSGMFMIAGGVLPAGHAAFFVTQQGTDQPVADSAVQLVAMPDGTAALRLADATYHVAMPAGLACPLGEIAARDGAVAYTIPNTSIPAPALPCSMPGWYTTVSRVSSTTRHS